ncbi:MAG TPA: lipopolysaccharide biosynthesis protein [Candidatus Sulfotelmatobacter sp.]
MKDLKEKTIRGGVARMGAQVANFVLRIGSLMILARLLDPKDFGLVGMVTAFTGVLNLFRDFGLSTATVQRAEVTEDQISTLFWINLLVGAVLALLSVALAPAVAAFYHEPRLLWITAVLATGFVFNAAGVQHSAILQREMRFTALAVINTIALIAGTVLAIGMAKYGYDYWALVAMTIAYPLVTTVGLWMTAAWMPGAPRRRSGLRSMIRFGGTITLNGAVMYVAYNFEKVLLGRFWGAEAIGVYGRAYQLVNIPTDNLNSAVGEVAFSALSRVQDDPPRLRSYFLKGYSLVTALTLPITILCALFAREAISILLGPKWTEAVPIFRLLAPTILIFAMINPFSWLLFAMGKVGRSLKIALVIAPLVIAGYVIGLPYGPTGVALGYSAAMAVWILPHIAWCVHGTPISFLDVLQTLSKPLLSGLVASVLPLMIESSYGQQLSPLFRLIVGVVLFLSVYAVMLLYAMGQKAFYLNLVRGLRASRSLDEKSLVPA